MFDFDGHGDSDVDDEARYPIFTPASDKDEFSTESDSETQNEQTMLQSNT